MIYVEKYMWVGLCLIAFAFVVHTKVVEPLQPIKPSPYRTLEQIMGDKYVSYPDEWDTTFRSSIIPAEESNGSLRNTRNVSK